MVIDAAVSREDKFLFTLNSGSHSIKSFRVGDDGGLVPASWVQARRSQWSRSTLATFWL
jgi:hypothetical protein